MASTDRPGWGPGVPTTYTPPLAEDFPSLWDKFGPIIAVVWRIAFGVTFDQWQWWLLRSVLETYPEGHHRAGQLRYRQVVISVGRQNGKTELAAALALVGLLRTVRAYVIGIASNREQAALVYNRVLQAVTMNASLAKLFRKTTETRGIVSHDGRLYETKAAKSAALQGLPISTGVIDEVHLIARKLWDDLLNGTGGRINALIVGITTAGDDDSELLKGLYKIGQEAAESEDIRDTPLERFGFFLWEAPEARVPDDDEELATFIKAANPSVAEGRADLENVISDIRAMPDTQAVIRYRLNRFVESTTSFIPMSRWEACRREAPFPRDVPFMLSVDKTPDWSYATIVASARDADGVIHTELVASLVKPDLNTLVDVCARLYAHGPNKYVMDGYGLKEVAAELKRRGLPVWPFSGIETVQASTTFFAKVMHGTLRHDGAPLLAYQLPRTIRKNVGESWRVSRRDSTTEIDGVMAEVYAVYAAEAVPIMELQIF